MRSMSACGARGDERETGVARVQMSRMRHLVGHHGAADTGTLRPARDAGLEERAVDEQLPAALEEVQQAHRPLRPIELVALLHRHPRHPSALGGQRVAVAAELFLLDVQLLTRRLPFLLRNDLGCLHACLLGQARMAIRDGWPQCTQADGAVGSNNFVANRPGHAYSRIPTGFTTHLLSVPASTPGSSNFGYLPDAGAQLGAIWRAGRHRPLPRHLGCRH